MVKLIKYVNGIDMSKDKFDACLMSVDVELNYKVIAQRQFSNNTTGFKELLQWMKKHCVQKIPLHILMEASGVYHEKLAIWLTEKKQQVMVVLPNKARKYMQALGLKSKNDKIDAQGLALMCAQHKFDLWQPIAKFYYELRLLTRHYQSTQEAKTMFFNQHHALSHSGYSSKEVCKQLEKTITIFEKQIKENKQHIINHINTNSEVQRKVNQSNAKVIRKQLTETLSSKMEDVMGNIKRTLDRLSARFNAIGQKEFSLQYKAARKLQPYGNLHTRADVTVTMGDSNSPVMDALVEIEGTSLKAITTKDGKCTISPTPIGSRKLIVTAPGFKEPVVTQEYAFKRGKATKITVAMTQFNIPASTPAATPVAVNA